MEKSINEILDGIQIPDIKQEDTSEEIILKFIEYIKEVERARGLTDEQIIAKYTNGCCADIEEAISDFLKINGIDSQTKRISCKIPSNNLGREDSPHYLVQISDTPDNYSYYDILGKHDSQFLAYFAEKFYIENPEYQRIVSEMTDYQMNSTVPEEAFYRVYSEMQKVSKKTSKKTFKEMYDEYMQKNGTSSRKKSFTDMYNEYMQENGLDEKTIISPKDVQKCSSETGLGMQEINGVTQETRVIITQEKIQTNELTAK